MSPPIEDEALPMIDLSGYINPKNPQDREQVIAEVRDASQRYGFFQVRGHGIPLKEQQGLVEGLRNFFSQPRAVKNEFSFLKDPGRRGYEASGDSHRDGDAHPDSKESFYIGREDPVLEPPGFHCPNVWPNMPEEKFHGPVWRYYKESDKLGRIIWEILLQGLGYDVKLMEGFAQRPIVQMKMIHYPGKEDTFPGQFGVGPHTDFGGVTVLLQQPDRHGLEVFHEGKKEWLPVQAIEDVIVINCGDMIQKWSAGRYKSAKHRVINKTNQDRYSCATFWHGDFGATNPLNPNDASKDTVGKLLLQRFINQFSLPKNIADGV